MLVISLVLVVVLVCLCACVLVISLVVVVVLVCLCACDFACEWEAYGQTYRSLLWNGLGMTALGEWALCDSVPEVCTV